MLKIVLIDQLIPYERNNKIHNQEQINKIAKSIKELGFRAPILVDENNIILAGHGRLLAAQKLKLKDVPSEYDLENLKLELQDLDDERLNNLFQEFDLFG